MCSVRDNTTLLVLSSLIRRSTDNKMFAPPRSFSQLTTSFFGAICQGILREPFVAWSFLLVSRLRSKILWLLLNKKFSHITRVRLLRRPFAKFVLTFRSPYAISNTKLFFFKEFFCLYFLFLLLLCSCQSSIFPRQRGFFKKKQAIFKRQLTYNIISLCIRQAIFKLIFNFF